MSFGINSTNYNPENIKTGNIVTKLDGKDAILDFFVGYDEITYKDRNGRYVPSSRYDSNWQSIDEVIKDEYGSNAEIKSVPEKYIFDNQSTTDIILTGNGLSSDQIAMSYHTQNNSYDSSIEHLVLGYRKYAPAGWAFFGGMVEQGETSITNMEKEINEEASIDLSEVQTTELGTFNKSEIRGSISTTVYHQVGNSLEGVKSGDDIEKLLFLNTKGLTYFLKNESHLMVPHHLELLQELSDKNLLPEFIQNAVNSSNNALSGSFEEEKHSNDKHSTTMKKD
jgi:ADP-ribose pyrophosphatase YjhB (NUDIX family)